MIRVFRLGGFGGFSFFLDLNYGDFFFFFLGIFRRCAGWAG